MHGESMTRKILAIQFKFLGDVVVATPALRALKDSLGQAELHVLVAAEAVPLLQHVRWIDRVWGFPRKRGHLNFREMWPVVKELRAQRFDVSIDLAGNDRGALLSALIRAPRRIGALAPRGSPLRRACYTQLVEALDATRHESVRLWAVAAALGISFPDELHMHIAPDPALHAQATSYLKGVEVLCFINTSQPKREWPLSHWVEFHRLASARGVAIGYTGGHSARERGQLNELRQRIPDARILEPAEPLGALIAAFALLKGFISADTGPLMFAAALDVPTIGLFGPTSAQCWAPLGAAHAWLQGSPCPCSGHADACQASRPCIAAVTAQQLHAAFLRMVGEKQQVAAGDPA